MTVADPKSLSAHKTRTLTEALRGMARDQLVELLVLRPDLCYPLPTDLVELATRATTSTSIARAIESLNAFQRLVTEALAALPASTSVTEIAGLLRADVEPAGVAEAVADLRARALLWGDDDQIQLVRAAREFFEPYPGGLAPPSLRPLTNEQIETALTGCDQTAHAVLARLAWSPAGAVRNANRTVDPATARTPVDQLLARQLLRPLDGDTVILPREVALHVRGGSFTADHVPNAPPPIGGRPRGSDFVDRAAAGAAFGLLHDLELAIHGLENTPHRLLRSGGLSARDVGALGRSLGSSAAHAGFILECASSAGLVAPASNLCLLPTTAYDRWLTLEAAVRWRMVADAWLAMPRFASRSTEPGAHVLGPEAEAPPAPALRKLILELAQGVGAGMIIELDELTAAMSWHRPRAHRAVGVELSTVVDWTWREATWLGLASLDALTSFAPALLAPAEPLPPALVGLFPTSVEQVIVQADLTAVAPGPLPPRIARELRLLADQESRGGAGVFRFSAASLRRAFDAGWAGPEIRAWLEQHSATGVPQPLSYLVNDVARQFGTIRVGETSSYLRSDDRAQTAALLAHPDAAFLGLREIAPGVLVSAADAYEVVGLLRALGHNPAVEDETGRTLAAPPQQRAPGPLTETPPRPPSASDAADVLLRRRPIRPPAEPASSVDQTLHLLRTAAEAGIPVSVRYVAGEGTDTLRELTPLGVSAGTLRAVDRTSGQVVSIPVSRVSSVEMVANRVSGGSGVGRPPVE